MSRLTSHPVLPVAAPDMVTFRFEGKPLTARRNEVLSSALFAHGIRTFGAHPEDGSPQGIFCANGQCSQCLVVADGLPVKACMHRVAEGMQVHKLVNLPVLPDLDLEKVTLTDMEELSTDLLVIGAGPAGLGAAIEAADAGLRVMVVDDKTAPGGKLLLQTHTFFGSVDECYAGTRGLDIGCILTLEAERRPGLTMLLDTLAVGVYSDGKVGIVQDGVYKLVRPRSLLVAAGARERALAFPGCDLPGVYGAGAFQTLLNRDLVVPSNRLFIIGGGNVGIIAGYHAMQAGITVVGLAEALPEVGAYWVHSDKLARLGVPIYTSTTVVSANGKEGVESVTTARVDADWRILPGTHKTFACDTLLVAVGLASINELYLMAKNFGMDAHVAGDAEEIAEASAAMFSGRVTGREIARGQGRDVVVPQEWRSMTAMLKAKPGHEDFPVVIPTGAHVFPVFHCVETIPCNPCSAVCSQGSVTIPEDGILPVPRFDGECTACLRCVAACPGLAVTLVDRRRGDGLANVTLPFEMPLTFQPGDAVPIVGHRGGDLGWATVVEIIHRRTLAACTAACPADVRAPGYIELIRKGEYERAADLLWRDMPLPAVCGRVCYHPCEDHCARASLDEPLAICRLKRFVADRTLDAGYRPKAFPRRWDERVAVIGSGPAGLACANELAHRGYPVTVFEAAPKAGGLLRYGIPAYRLPDRVLDRELDCLVRRGMEIRTGEAITDVEALLEDGYAAVFVAVGAAAVTRLGAEGEDVEGVVGMLDFLRDVNTGAITTLKGTVAVIGGGNSALDAARAAIRLGAHRVRVIYRRSREQMPAHDWEVEQAGAEGVEFDFLTLPTGFSRSPDGTLSIACYRMELGPPDASGRPRPVPVEGSGFELGADLVISAIGQAPDMGPLAARLSTSSWGAVQVDPTTLAASLPGVFAGGDVVSGAATVVEAFGAGKRAAESVDRYLRGMDPAEDRDVPTPVAAPSPEGMMPQPRVSARSLPLTGRPSDFQEIEKGMTEEEARQEARRCLGCGLQSGSMPGPAIMAEYPVTPGALRSRDGSVLVTLEVAAEVATKVAGTRIQPESATEPVATVMPPESDDDVIVCRCERVSLGQIRRAVRAGLRDMNQLKGMMNAGLGACDGKTCGPIIQTIMHREGVPPGEVTGFTERPLVAEVPLGSFAGLSSTPGER